MYRLFATLLAALLTACLALPLYAQDEDEDEAEAAKATPATEALYIPLVPAFVVNYGGPGRLRYLKVEMTVRVADIGAAQAVRHHMPAIRDRLVVLLSRQEELVVDTLEGKEQLRQDALAEVRQAIAAEEGDGITIVDLFFDNLLVQR